MFICSCMKMFIIIVTYYAYNNVNSFFFYSKHLRPILFENKLIKIFTFIHIKYKIIIDIIRNFSWIQLINKTNIANTVSFF